MKTKTIVWVSIIIVAVVIQFFPSGLPEINNDNENDILLNNNVPENVKSMLRTSCYDCHSNETVYPWYAYVAPVSWLVSWDIRNGHKKLNFSEWESLDKIKKAEHLDDMSEALKNKEMPLPIYLLMHSGAKLSPEQRQTLVNWTENFADSLFE